VLLVRPFAGRGEFVAAIVDRFLPAASHAEAGRAAARERLLDLLARELDSAEPEPSARSVLGFLRRRGLKLALLTNSASPFREPFESAGWAELFAAVLFSCDLGTRKPAAETYRAALSALQVEPDEALSVGDSPVNDVAAPRALGMSALGVAGARSLPGVDGFADLAWLAGFESGVLESLLPIGRRVALGDLAGTVAKVDLLPDARQGRYNLVAEVEVSWEAGFRERLFVKRFRHPEAVWIESFIRPLLAEVGIATNRVAIVDGVEPLLLAREVTGARLGSSPPDPPLAHEIGRHFGAAFLFSNADIRPRNMLLTEIAGRPCLTALDYEYVLFDRALDLSDLAFRYDPNALARLPREELVARGGRRVLSRGAIVRGRREFLDSRTASAEAVAAFRAGWSEIHA
ncbi:MAG: HAD family hydrolase, partial [Candidatus Binatia bacterium]